MLHAAVGCLCFLLLTSCCLYFLELVGATVVIVVTAVAVVIALPLLFFIHADPASWLLILLPCVNR